MFRESITVKGADVYTAKKIPLSKEISNVSNSYHIRIQAYQLDQKIEGETVFILQLKHTRNVRNVVNSHAPAVGISMHNNMNYPMDMGGMAKSRAITHAYGGGGGGNHGPRKSAQIRSDRSKTRSSSSFFDQIWLQHKSKRFLHATVNTIFRAFDCDDFIKYNEHTNQFEFKFEVKQNMTTLTKNVSLSRKEYSKEEAETMLKDRHSTFESPCKVQVVCVNSHEINDPDWDFEVNLTLLPGKYDFYVDELFDDVPTVIHARDYPRIRSFYEEKLKEFVYSAKIFDKYLTHLSTFEPRYKMMEWTRNGCESGPLFGLYSVLCDIDEDDDIWKDLFQICLKEKVDDKIIRNSISEQTVADFIALALKHYVKDTVKRRIKYRELQKQQNKAKQQQQMDGDNNNNNSNKSMSSKQRKQAGKNKDGLDKYILSESDRYILSIILPYFGSPPLKTVHKSVANESLTSGLFNHFCEKLQIVKKPKRDSESPADSASSEYDVDDGIRCIKVPALDLKNKLLKHLHVEKYDVVKQYYVAVLQHVPAEKAGDKTRWTFYVRPSTYSEIFNGKHKINMNAYTFNDYFEFKQRDVERMECLNLIIKVVDVSFECSWAMWISKKLKQYTASLGYWKLLSTFDENPRVPVDHLDCMLALLRHDAMSVSNKLLKNENQYLSVVFLKEKNSVLSDELAADAHLKGDSLAANAAAPSANNPYNRWTTDDVEAEYQLTFWNGKPTGNSSVSLKLVHAANASKNKKWEKYKTKDSHFMHFRSKDDDSEWLWYDNDCAKYKEYALGELVPKQLEATYQGVREEMFPLEQFKRDPKATTKESIFNCASLPYMSQEMVNRIRGFKHKPFVLRFTFHKHKGKIVNIEQLAINNYYDQFPRNVKRVYSGKTGVMINDEEQRVSSLGQMNIYQSEKSIIICWKFPEDHESGITKTYHFKVQLKIEHESKFKHLLDSWRTNTLFDQTMSNRAMVIVESRMWKTDRQMPDITDITQPDDESEAHLARKSARRSGAYIDDEDDDKDEEKSSKPSRRREDGECIPCRMIEENSEEEQRRRRAAQKRHDEEDAAGHDEDADGIPSASKVARDRSQSLAQIDKLAQLYKSQAIMQTEWQLLDELDDRQRSNSCVVKNNPTYKFEPKFDSIKQIWQQRHAPHKFRQKLFKLVSLTFVQSIVSVMENHLNERRQQNQPENNSSQRPLIIVISDESRLYQELFALNAEDYESQNSKSLSFLFDAKGDVKRIDSKRNISSIRISKLQEVIDQGYLHEFAAMTSLKYPSSLVLFTRSNDSNSNIYVSHNGYINKLSLAFNNEDLHYFLPLFIPLKVGDCVNIEAFSSPDYGTIVELWTNENKTNIMYQIRSKENVFYIMNYYKLVNREHAKDYWYKTRKTVINGQSAWDGVRLWKSEETDNDPSDTTHPLHGIVLAAVESSKQAIASIESQLNEFSSKEKAKAVEDKKLAIQHKLQHSGAIFLFYKTVKVEDKDEEIIQFEKEEEERRREANAEREATENNEQPTEQQDGFDSDEEDMQQSNDRGLHHLVTFLKRNKLITNVLQYEHPQPATYNDFRSKAMEILETNCSNRVFLCHMIETKKYVLEEVDNRQEEEPMGLGMQRGNSMDEDHTGFADPEEEDEWLTFEPSEEDEPHKEQLAPVKKVVIRSSFTCSIKYRFEMCSLHSPVLTVEDIMIMQNPKKNWTNEDRKLLTQFHLHSIYNKFDLLDKPLISKLKAKLEKTGSGSDETKQKLLSNKFTKFTEAVKGLLDEHKIPKPLTQYVIAGVETTRNAKLLQEYIYQFRRYNPNLEDNKTADLDGDAGEIIEANNDKTMIVAYNPIQTVVVTSQIIKDVTHPIHLYRAAYDEKFYPKDQIHQLNAEWMQTHTKQANIIQALSTLLRYNKKYEIILVPSSIHLDKENFLETHCEKVAPEHESIADYRITFLYKGLLYRYDKKKAKKSRQQKSLSLSVMKQQSLMSGLDDLDDDEEKIFVDEIKFLLRLLHDNISEEQPDSLDPDEHIFNESQSSMHNAQMTETEDKLQDIVQNISAAHSHQPSFSYRHSEDFGAGSQLEIPLLSPSVPSLQSSHTADNRLRATIKRKHTDRIFRWLNVGCGSCFLHESSGTAKEIGPKKNGDYEREFPKQLQKAMFLYYIDCRVPFNEDIIPEASQCAICKQLMIDPADIGNPDCSHVYCKLCIQQWVFVNHSHNRYGNSFDNMEQLSRSTCPLCRRPINKIQINPSRIPQMKKGIPSTIYQQIMEENRSRFLRQYLVDKYYEERERVLQAEQNDQNLGQQINDPYQANRLAGYMN